jgi:molecular chaperone GrpE (heat shock protein)
MAEALTAQASDLAAIRTQIERFHDRSRAQEDIIGRMQARIEELQADQVRALLGPVATQLATLHGEIVEIASRNTAAPSWDRVAKELGMLALHVESGLELLGMVTVGAAPGTGFDRRWHTATGRTPTADRGLDKTVAAVLRQGFGIEGAQKATVPARVIVYQYDPQLEAAAPPAAGAAEPAAAPGPPLPPPFAPPPAGPSTPGTDVPLPPVPPGYHER